MPVGNPYHPTDLRHNTRPTGRAIQLASAGLVIAITLAGPILSPQSANAQNLAASQTRTTFNIPAGPLSNALNRFAAQTGLYLAGAGELTQGKKSNGLTGEYTVQQGLQQLLAGSGIRFQFSGSNTVTLVGATDNAVTLAPVTVNAEGIGESAYGPVEGFTAKRSATGSKTDTPILEIPQSISVITADQVKTTGATTLKEALSYTPGVSATPWGNDSQYDWIYLRGFDAYSPGFYQDGLQLRNSGNWAVWQTENYGIERIEYLRGPSSVLYGQNSAGGLINVVSKRPTRAPIREISAQIGTDNRRQIATDLSGQADSDGKWLYRLTALERDADLSVGDDLPNDRTYIAPSLTWRPSNDTQLTLLAEYLDMNVASNWSNFPVQGTLLPNPNGNIPASTFWGEPDFSRYNQEQWMIGYLFEHHLNDTWTLRQNARYGEFDTGYQSFYSPRFVTVNAGDPSAPENFRLLDRTPFGSDESASQFTLDNQVEAHWRAGRWQHTLLLGIDYQRSDFDVTAYWGGTVDPIDVYNPVYGSPVTLTASPFIDANTVLKQTGFYLQDQIKFDEHWVLALGGRFDRAVIENDDQLSGSNDKQTDEHFSGRAGLVYLVGNGLAPYISYSESFSPTATINPATGNPFDPETGRQYEVGMRYQPPGANSTYSIAAFDLMRQNYVTYDTGFAPRNTGEVTVRGIELEAVAEVLPNTNLKAAYSWTPEADVTDSANPSEIGKRSFNYAEHQFSLWSDYTFGFGLKLGAGARYTGSTYGANEEAPAKIPDYTLLDALIGYEIGPWELAVNARNLTDKEYLSNCNDSECYYGETRSVIGTVNYHW